VSQQINLYEARLRPRHELVTANRVGIAALVLLVSMTVTSWWTRVQAERQVQSASVVQAQATEAQTRLTELARVVAERKTSPALAAEIEVAKMMLRVREEVLDVLDSDPLGNTAGFSGVMTGFARQAQSDLWLTGFSLTAGGESIEIRGRLLDAAKLPPYVQKLSLEPIFQGRRFAALEMQDGGEPGSGASAAGTAVRPPVTTPQGSVAEGSLSAASLPHFTEFVLRSEKAGANKPGGPS